MSYPRSTRISKYAVICILLVALGPYLLQGVGVRLEHLVLYLLFLWAIIMIRLRLGTYRISLTLFIVVVLIATATLWTLVVSMLAGSSVPALKVIAGLENYVQPIALILVLSVLLQRIYWPVPLRLLRTACIVICLLLCVNTAVSGATIFFDTWPFVQYFVRGNVETDYIVWQGAASMGRYSGIFNQPIEAGLAYSIGLAGWVYWYTTSHRPNTLRWLLLFGMLVGGALSVSKVFILGGVPMFLLYLAWVEGLRISPKKLMSASVFVLGFGSVVVWMREHWVGANYLLRLFDLDNIRTEGLISLYTAGRFGTEENIVKRLFAEVMQESPLYGFGFGSLQGALDNAYIEFLYQGGIVALVLYLAVLLTLSLHVFRFIRRTRDECRLLAVLLVIIVGAGMGAPVLTLNRSSIFLWVLIVLAITASVSTKQKVMLFHSQQQE